jgi:hypothetical protein
MDINAVSTGITDLFLADADLLAALGGAGANVLTQQRLYNTKAPQNVTSPYTVFQYIAGSPDPTFTSDGEIMTWQFSIFHQSDDPLDSTTIDDVFKKLCAAYDDETLTITGYTSIAVTRGVSSFLATTDDIQMYVVTYEIMIEKN